MGESSDQNKQEEKKAYAYFSRDDVTDFKEVFEYFDSDRKGEITARQLGTTLRALEPRPEESYVSRMIEDITQHKKGVLNFRDFLDMLHATITDTHKAIDDNNNKQKTGNAPRRKRSCYTNLSAEQIEDIKDAFNMFDQNGDGSISTDELKSVLESMGLDASDESIREMLHEAGCSEKDSLDYPDFLTMMTRKAAEQDLNKEIKDVFRFFDEDDDGSITGEEVKRVMAKLGENLSEEEINEMVKEADLDGNGRIEYAEFVKMITMPKS